MIRLNRSLCLALSVLGLTLLLFLLAFYVPRQSSIGERLAIETIPSPRIASIKLQNPGHSSVGLPWFYQKWLAEDHEKRAEALKTSDKTYALYYVAQDQVHCKTKIRLGKVLDGGKYVCSPHVLYNKKDCIIYSLGVAGDTSFESALISLSNDSCEIYGYDMGETSRQPFMKLPSAKVHFDAVTIGTGNSKDNMAITAIMQQNVHTRLDILKIDVESAEYGAMPPVLDKVFNREIIICQILIEIHSGGGQPLKLLQQFERAGYLLFAQETNMVGCSPHKCAEYAYVHKDCFEELGLSEADLYNSISYIRDFDSKL